MSDQSIEDRVRQRVEKRTKQRNAFMMHLIAFVITNAVLWMLYLSDRSQGAKGGLPWPIYVTFFWGIGLAGNALSVYQNSGAAVARREATIQREIEFERANMGSDGMYEKPKRDDRAMRLSDDGELIPAEDEDLQDSSPIRKAKLG